MIPTPGLPRRDLVSGVVIASGAVVSVVMMSHHPAIHAHETEEFFAEAVRLSFATKFVHGTLIAVIVAMVFGFCGFAQRLGLGRSLVRFGLVAYLFGSLALIGAAVVNGLVFPGMAARFADSSVEEMEAARIVLAWNQEVNQALDITGVLGWSAAVLAWSLAIVRLAGAWRWIGALGIVLGIGGASAFLSGLLRFDVHGFGLYVLAQSAWSLAVGVRLALPDRAARA